MSKKKRNKPYRGSNAAAKPSITKVSAVKRAPIHQWWVDNRRVVKIGAIIGAIVFVIALVIVGLISIIW